MLLYRGVRTRLERIAPFLDWDSKPYYVAADGRSYVVDVGYATTDRLPYSEPFGGVRYLRTTVLGVTESNGATKAILQVDAADGATALDITVFKKGIAAGQHISVPLM